MMPHGTNTTRRPKRSPLFGSRQYQRQEFPSNRPNSLTGITEAKAQKAATIATRARSRRNENRIPPSYPISLANRQQRFSARPADRLEYGAWQRTPIRRMPI